MKRSTIRTVVPRFPGYAEEVASAVDFARCGVERRMAILTSLTRLMELYTRNLARADARLAEAAKAVAIEKQEIEEERAFLATVANTYVEFSQVIASDAIAMSRDSGSRPTGRDAKQARGEARQSGAESASPNPRSQMSRP